MLTDDFAFLKGLSFFAKTTGDSAVAAGSKVENLFFVGYLAAGGCTAIKTVQNALDGNSLLRSR